MIKKIAIYLYLSIILNLLFINQVAQSTESDDKKLKKRITNNQEIKIIKDKVKKIEDKIVELTRKKSEIEPKIEEIEEYKKELNKDSSSPLENIESDNSSKKIEEYIDSNINKICESNSCSSQLKTIIVGNSQSIYFSIERYLEKCIKTFDENIKKRCYYNSLIKEFPDIKFTNNDFEILNEYCREIEKYNELLIKEKSKKDKIIADYEFLNSKQNNLEDEIKNIDKQLDDNKSELDKVKHKLAIKKGDIKPQNIEDIIIFFDASDDNKYTTNPPLDGPSKEQYFVWRGTLAKKIDNDYIVWDVDTDLLAEIWNKATNYNPLMKVNEIKAGGFVFKNIKQKFSELQQNKKVIVVGKYISNTEIKLINGETTIIPVLTDCYVE